MTHPLFKSLRLDGFLSFAPGSPAVELRPLNVLIGPNGSGKSNFLEGFELLRATTTLLQGFLREGGTPEDWIWKGKQTCKQATITAGLNRDDRPPEEYQIALGQSGPQLVVLEEHFREVSPRTAESNPFTYFQIGGTKADVATKFVGANGPSPDYEIHSIDRQYIKSDQSIFVQRTDLYSYPDLNQLAQLFSGIRSFRDWTFGRYSPVRSPQSTSLPNDALISDGSNLALFLTDVEHVDISSHTTLIEQIRRFLPRFERISTRVVSGVAQIYFHEEGNAKPIPAQRLSDGTLRFVAMLAMLLAPGPTSVICLEEPELGLHPDAMTIVADVLRDVSRRTQIIVTTHSDALLSRLSDDAGSVLVCEHLGDTTVLERLDPDKLRYWLEKYGLGEIWRVGKLGGNP